MTRLASWAIFIVTLALSLAGVALMLLNRDTAGTPDSFGYREIEPTVTLAFAYVGLLLTLKLPKNAVGWLFCTVGVLGALNNLSIAYAIYSVLTEPGSLPAATLAAWSRNWLWIPLVGLSEVYLLLLFPDGRIPPRFRPVGHMAPVALACAFAGLAFEAGELGEFPGVDNPLGAPTSLELPLVMVTLAGFTMLIACSALGAASQLTRYRKASDDERHQIRWFAAASTLVALALALQLVVVGPELLAGEMLVGTPARKAIESSVLVSITFIPIATGIAVLRYRLYDIDIIINRTLVYVPLTAILAGLYVTLTGLLRALFTEVTHTGSDAAIALGTLAVVAVLTPAKNHLQALVDRHFKETLAPASELERLAEHARSVLQVVQTDRFVEDFLARTVKTFDAAAGAVQLILPGQEERRFYAGDEHATEWPVQLPLLHDGVQVGMLLLGPRTGGRRYSPSEVEALARAATVIPDLAAAHPQLQRSALVTKII